MDISILTFHGIMSRRTQHAWQPFRRYVAPETLDAHIAALRPHYTFITLRRAIEILRGAREPVERGIVLTFDDGCRNNATEAWPILRRHGVPGTFFVTTSFLVEPRPYWFDRLDYAINRLPESQRSLCVQRPSGEMRCDVHGRAARRATFFTLAAECKRSTTAWIERIVTQVEEQAESVLMDRFADDEWAGLMSVDDARRLSGEGAEIGSHTVDHLLLDGVDADEEWRQISESRVALEQMLGQPCETIAYPSGRTSPRTVSLCQAAGYRAGLTVQPGRNKIGENPYLLRRFSVSPQLSPTELLVRITGLW
jgi:peptidoglycan/xylan/chitin deacetylase (PgdA/CDA1 family)